MKKIFFLHVPKTGGSSISEMFESNHENAHCERFFYPNLESGYDDDFDQIKKFDFMSGHIRLKSFVERLNTKDYFVFTFIRNPLEQFISHFNWLYEIRNKTEDFFNNHPKRIKKISDDIFNLDLEDINNVINLLEKYIIFQNHQSKHILINNDIKSLKYYDYIGDTNNIKNDINNIFSMQNIKKKKDHDHKFKDIKNKNYNYVVNKEYFKSSNVFMDFYYDYNSKDEALYKHIKNQQS